MFEKAAGAGSGRNSGRTAWTEELRAALRAWLEDVMDRTGLSASRLARECGISDTTLTRFLNSPTYKGGLSTETIAAIVSTFGVATPRLPGEAPLLALPHPGLREDGVAYVSQEAPDVDRLVTAALAGRTTADPWVMKSNILALAGVRPGDVMIIDQAVTPRDGDVVVAQQLIGTGARTLFRLWQMPNLVAATFDPTETKPLQVDGETVQIRGVMTDLIRRRG